MGAIHVTVKLSWPDAEKPYEALFLVDTGAADSIAPGKSLLEAGFKPVGKMSYELANGETEKYEFCGAMLEFMGESTFGRVILGPVGTEPLLGVTALESVGIIVDPANKTLKRLPAIPLK